MVPSPSRDLPAVDVGEQRFGGGRDQHRSRRPTAPVSAVMLPRRRTNDSAMSALRPYVSAMAPDVGGGIVHGLVRTDRAVEADGGRGTDVGAGRHRGDVDRTATRTPRPRRPERPAARRSRSPAPSAFKIAWVIWRIEEIEAARGVDLDHHRGSRVVTVGHLDPVFDVVGQEGVDDAVQIQHRDRLRPIRPARRRSPRARTRRSRRSGSP